MSDQRFDDLSRVTALHLHEHGTEVTPSEVDSTRTKFLKSVREMAERKGISVPEDDWELMVLVKRLLDEGGKKT